MGVVPLEIKTGRYDRKDLVDRICFNCINKIADEKQVILEGLLYDDLGETLFKEISSSFNNFRNISDDKFIFLFNTSEIFSIVAKTCHNILTRQMSIVYKLLIF